MTRRVIDLQAFALSRLRAVPEWPLASHTVHAEWDAAERERVITYLEQCYETGFMEPESRPLCRLGCAPEEVTDRRAGSLTDGTWQFSESLLHYVRRHGLRPPDDFLSHMRKHNFDVPQLPERDHPPTSRRHE